MNDVPEGSAYQLFLEALKARVNASRIQASTSVNRELILLYWSLGRDILERQEKLGWGAKVIERLSRDLCRAFPKTRGFSTRNLKYMRAFAEAWPDEQVVQQAVAQIPWGHNLRIMDKLDDSDERLFYVQRTLEHGWSRDVLVMQIERRLHEREGQALTNFSGALPAPQSDLAQQLTRDPYCFDFLSLTDDVQERDLEQGLIHHIRDFLLELGVGFAFVGAQVPLEVAGRDFYLDLLFYHLSLRCYVVIELKAGSFQPEYAGKLNFYLSAVDDQMRHPADQPTIGILLVKSKEKLLVEYALRDLQKPIGVANWETRLVEALPSELKGRLPSVEEMEAELLGENPGN